MNKRKMKMKKIMIILAVAAMAFCAEAATVKWSVGNVRIPVADNVAVSQSGITVSTANSAFAAGTLTIFLSYMNGDSETAITSAAVTGNGVKAAADFWTASQAKDAVTANGGDSVIDFIIRATYTTADGVYEYTGTVSSDIANAASDTKNVTIGFNMANHGSWNYTAVPEPTSGLLMLVGLAGLALRRRRA